MTVPGTQAKDDALRLTVDAGNSSIKLLVFRGSEPAESRQLTWGQEEELGGWLTQLGPLASAAISSVAGAGSYERLVSAVSAGITGPVLAPPATGLELDVRHPETVGHDRLFAAAAALARAGSGALVVDAGTALTVDAVLASEGERGQVERCSPIAGPSSDPAADTGAAPAPGRILPGGIFLGGAIAPGPGLLARSLAEGGAQLPEVSAELAVPPALGRHTADALRSGILVGFVGAARELVARLREETGLGSAPLFLTGGARALLRDGLSGAREVEHLVHEGLLAALLAAEAEG